MPPSWLAIKQARPDLTDYVIHWTRGRNEDGKSVTAFEILKRIIMSGVLLPSFAPKARATVGGVNNTIQGPIPAACFTEQPLAAFIKSCKALRRYHPYAIAVRKDRLFEYGGRPALYGDKNLLAALPNDQKYMWVQFNPIPVSELGGYPLDWTHEREWRAITKPYNYPNYGPSPSEGIPLLLPPDFRANPPLLYLPWVIVKTSEQRAELQEWIAALPPYSGLNKVLGLYFENLPRVFIIALDEVEKYLNAGDERWARLDTLPYEEIAPDAVADFQRIGWSRRQ